MVLSWVAVTGLVESLVSGLWMAVWVLAISTVAVLILWGSGVSWVILALVYLGGVFILMVYISGSDYMTAKEGGGGWLVVIGVLLACVLASVVLVEEQSDLGLGVLEGGGLLLVLLTAPILMWVMVNVNWVMYGHSGTFRSL
uniref:NADH dehydrogenase subunit 6 n=1 Tax=Sphaerirostris lanceoides TaxID=2169581 RepID=A0A6M8Y6U3_9BILA|nr:NADH dehydrogenase subunit 6 [Sphaerirostris lanceoides]